jgi:hypothetical protein
VDQPDRDGIEEMQLLPPLLAGDDEPGLLEHLEVLHHAEAGHRQLGLQLRQRAAVTCEQEVEQEATRGVGKRLEHAVVVGHVIENR